MKNTANNLSADDRATITARVAYMGAKGRFYGSTLHLDFLGGTWPTTDENLDLAAHVGAQLAVEGWDIAKIVAKNFELVRPVVNTDPSAFDLTESAWNAQRRTI